MASVVMADDGIAFDGLMAETAPLGGARDRFRGARRGAGGARSPGRGAQPLPRGNRSQRGSVGHRSRATCRALAISTSAIAATGSSGSSAGRSASCFGCTARLLFEEAAQSVGDSAGTGRPWW